MNARTITQANADTVEWLLKKAAETGRRVERKREALKRQAVRRQPQEQEAQAA